MLIWLLTVWFEPNPESEKQAIVLIFYFYYCLVLLSLVDSVHLLTHFTEEPLTDIFNFYARDFFMNFSRRFSFHSTTFESTISLRFPYIFHSRVAARDLASINLPFWRLIQFWFFVGLPSTQKKTRNREKKVSRAAKLLYSPSGAVHTRSSVEIRRDREENVNWSENIHNFFNHNETRRTIAAKRERQRNHIMNVCIIYLKKKILKLKSL